LENNTFTGNNCLGSREISADFKIKGGCKPCLNYCFVPFFNVNRDSLVGIENLLAGRSGNRNPLTARLSPPSRPALWPTQPHIQLVPGLSQG